MCFYRCTHRGGKPELVQAVFCMWVFSSPCNAQTIQYTNQYASLYRNLYTFLIIFTYFNYGAFYLTYLIFYAINTSKFKLYV